jgi:hypothetical protein
VQVTVTGKGGVAPPPVDRDAQHFRIVLAKLRQNLLYSVIWPQTGL